MNDDEAAEGRTGATLQQPDDDRSAILARRQRFIALALAGLTTSSCGRSQKPASAATGEGEPQADAEGDSDGVDPADRPPPRPSEEYYRTTGEYWQDELESYHFHGVDVCEPEP